jgi:ATP-independent RNA helicase DbpA
MREPKEVKLLSAARPAKIRQRFYEVREDERLHAVSLLLNHFRPVSTLAFCNTKQQCRDLVEVLQGAGLRGAGTARRPRAARPRPGAGAFCQPQRQRAGGHRHRRARAGHRAAGSGDQRRHHARPEVHTHRIGRTGRVDEEGWAFSLASLDEMGAVGRIEQAGGFSSDWQPLSRADGPPAGGALRRRWPRCRSWAAARRRSAPATCWAR